MISCIIGPHVARRLKLVVAAALLSGCIAGPGDPAELDAANFTLTTDRTEYALAYVSGEGMYRQYAFDIVATFRNNSEHTVYLTRCRPDSPSPSHGVDVVVSTGGWGSAYLGPSVCERHDRQIPVRPGQTRTDVLRITGPVGWGGTPKAPLGTLTGLMQLTYGVTACRACGSSVARPSNSFTVSMLP